MMATSGGSLRCRACSTPVQRPEQRRNLASSASQHVVPVLKGIVERLHPRRVLTLPANDAFVCRSCFTSLEKLIKLKNDVGEMERKLEDSLKAIEERFELRANVSPAGTPLRASKRQSLPSADSTPRRKRRRLLDTPTSKTVQQLQVLGESPLVAVGLQATLICMITINYCMLNHCRLLRRHSKRQQKYDACPSQ